MALPFAQPIVCPQLIGRAAQLDLLAQLIERTCGGAGGIVLVSGEAGIGKSRLVGEARDRAVDRGWTVAQGNCFEPIAPCRTRRCSTCCARSPAESAGRRARPPLGPVAPELVKLAARSWPCRLPGARARPPLDPEQEKRRLFEAVAQALGGARGRGAGAARASRTCTGPTTPASTLLLFLARRARARGRVLLLLTYRSDEVAPAPGPLPGRARPRAAGDRGAAGRA